MHPPFSTGAHRWETLANRGSSQPRAHGDPMRPISEIYGCLRKRPRWAGVCGALYLWRQRATLTRTSLGHVRNESGIGQEPSCEVAIQIAAS